MFGNPFLTDVQTLRERTRMHIGDGASKVGFSMQRETVLNLLNEAFATETVCVLRYQRYQFLHAGTDPDGFADKFEDHAREEQRHADQIAQRIVELNGQPNFLRDGLVSWGHGETLQNKSFIDLVKEDMIAECITIDNYRDIIDYLSDRDPRTHRVIAGILTVEKQHAREMATLLETMPA